MNHIAQTSSSFKKPTPKADRQAAQTKQGATQLADGTVNAATRLADNAKDEIGKRLTSEKDRAAGAVETIAGAMRHTAEELEELGPLPGMVERAADGIERVADFVQTRSPAELLREVEGYARREPAMFIGGAFLLGLLGARFLKSNGNRPIESSESGERSEKPKAESIAGSSNPVGRLPPPTPPRPAYPSAYPSAASGSACSSAANASGHNMPDEEHAVSTPPPPFPSAGDPYGSSSAAANPYGIPPLRSSSAQATTPRVAAPNGNGAKAARGRPGEPVSGPLFVREGS